MDETKPENDAITPKIEEQTNKINELYQSQKEIVDFLKTLNAPVPQTKEEPESNSGDLADLLISNPAKALEMIEKRVETKLSKRMNDASEAQQKVNSVLSQLQTEFPELADMSHDLTKTALQIYDKMSSGDKSNPLAYKAAILEAATKTGTKPKSQRSTQQDDNFSLSSSRSFKSPKAEKIDPKTLEFAKIMGLDVDNKDVLKRLSDNSNKDLSKYSPLN